MPSVAEEKMVPDRTPMIGRDRESAFLIGELELGARLVTITGPSGMGKTRLSRRVLAGMAPALRGAGGSFFCSLAACRTQADLRALVARALGSPQLEGAELPLAMANRGPLLLVLDNLDDIVAEAPAVLREWLDYCAELQILITSIVPTGMEEEVRFELGPLEAADAVRLYHERAHRAWAGKTFSEQDEQAVVELVGRLDGIPLAIELAASRVRVLPPRALLSRIGDRLELLQSGKPGRHGSLLQALELTWELLPEEEQRALAWASVFAGGFTLETAEALLGGLERPVLDVLDGLRSKALLQLDDSNPPRFSPYESVRDFAFLQLAKEQEVTLRRHAAYFVERGAVHAEELEGREPLASIRWLRAEQENLIAVHRRFLSSDPGVAARAGLALLPFLELEGSGTSMQEVLETTVEAARRSEDPRLLLRALRSRSIGLRWQGKGEQTDLAEGLALARALGERREEAYFWIAEGMRLRGVGAFEEAEERLRDAVRMGGEAGDPRLESLALFELGRLAFRRDDLAASAAYIERALTLVRRSGPLQLEGRLLVALGAVLTGQQRYAEARQLIVEARQVSIRLENRFSELLAILNLGGLATTTGELDEAEVYLSQVFEEIRRLGHRPLEANTIGNLAVISIERGRLRLATQQLSEAQAMYRELGELRDQAEMLWFLALTNALLGNQAEARRNLADTRSVFERVSDWREGPRFEHVKALLEIGEAKALLREGREEEARALEARARSRWSAAREGEQTETLIVSNRILEGALLRLREGQSAGPAAGPLPLVVGREAAWFQVQGKERVDLLRRGAIRRILRALVERCLAEPGTGISPEVLFEVGWQGERIMPDAAAARVHSSIWKLRSLGLEGVVARHADGYLLDPEIPILQPVEDG